MLMSAVSFNRSGIEHVVGIVMFQVMASLYSVNSDNHGVHFFNMANKLHTVGAPLAACTMYM